jgi:hypothetical protein
VQEHGCAALANIARADDLLRILVLNAGAAPTIQQAMRSFPWNNTIQYRGKILLRAFEGPESQEDLYRTSGKMSQDEAPF